MEGDKDDADTVFKAFANSFEKSSSHWQARDEHLSDIKQTKSQTTAELDIYIKDLIRRCQFPPEDQESRKIDLLYHATAHFEVRKFVHNAKQDELRYDRMIEVAKAHERTCQEYQIHKQAHSMATPVTVTLIHSFKPMPCLSLSRKALQEDLWQVWMLTQPWGMPSLWDHMQQVLSSKSLGPAM